MLTNRLELLGTNLCPGSRSGTPISQSTCYGPQPWRHRRLWCEFPA